MGTITAVCMSEGKGTPKTERPSGTLMAGHGLAGDGHAGDGRRQISLLALERIDEFRRRGAEVAFGDFGENIVTSGVDLDSLKPGDRLRCGDAILEITQIGKECHSRCRIYDAMGDCIMPKHGVFARVLRGGGIKPGDAVVELRRGESMAMTVAVVTVSDKGSRGEREDLSGREIEDVVFAHGFDVAARLLVPDERDVIEPLLLRLCDKDKVDLVLTTGGTGFSPRDVTPEATLAVIERACPGIPEAMRALSLAKTKRAMLSRAAAGIRGRTLIVNLPGSPRAVRECLGFVIDELVHGLAILKEVDGECAS